MQQIIFRAMGSQILALLDTDDPKAEDWLADVPKWFAEWELVLSRFRAESELSQLNKQAGSPVQVSPTLWSALQAALQAAQLSDGLVSPLVGAALEALGYDRDFDELASQQSDSAAQPPAPLADYRSIKLNPTSHTITLPAHAHLDLGGTAKGWAADQAMHRLAKHGRALVDAGGDIAVSGSRSDGTPWPIGVIDPHETRRHLDLLLIDMGGLATSGRDYRRWRQQHFERHHLIDPRTQQPAITDVLTATVIAPTLLEAETAAKTALILGSHTGMGWIEAHATYAALMVLEDGTVRRSSGWDAHCWPAKKSVAQTLAA
jgi:FAD:protein FMN transferase